MRPIDHACRGTDDSNGLCLHQDCVLTFYSGWQLFCVLLICDWKPTQNSRSPACHRSESFGLQALLLSEAREPLVDVHNWSHPLGDIPFVLFISPYPHNSWKLTIFLYPVSHERSWSGNIYSFSAFGSDF